MSTKLTNIIDNINRKGKGREWLTMHTEGTYSIRILQDLHDEEAAPFEEFYLHTGFVLPAYQKAANVQCLRTKDCPMCLKAKSFKLKGAADLWKYEARAYYVYNVIDRKDGKLKILKITWAAHNKLVAKIIEAARDGLNLMHFKTGRDVEITVRSIGGSKLDYKAYILSETETKQVAGKVIEELKHLKPLSEAYKAYTKQEMQDIVDGKMPSNNYNFEKPKVSKASLIENLTKKLAEAGGNENQSQVSNKDNKPNNTGGKGSSVEKNIVKTDSLRQLEEEINNETDSNEKKESESKISDKLNKLNIFEEE